MFYLSPSGKNRNEFFYLEHFCFCFFLVQKLPRKLEGEPSVTDREEKKNESALLWVHPRHTLSATICPTLHKYTHDASLLRQKHGNRKCTPQNPSDVSSNLLQFFLLPLEPDIQMSKPFRIHQCLSTRW